MSEAIASTAEQKAVTDGALSTIGRVALLALALTRALRHPGKWGGLALEEIGRQGIGSLPLVFLLNALGGAVTSQQTGFQFEGSLPLWVIGSVVAASVITELAPMLTGLALVGMVGARITAELGAMTVSQQVDALEMIGRDPVEYLVVPRVVAGVITAPLLVAFALPVGLAAGWVAAVLVTPVTTAEFVHGVRFYMRDFPMFFALIKAAAFGLAITFTASYVGLRARGGSMGVGRATTTGVVAMLTAILFLDALLAPLLKVIRL